MTLGPWGFRCAIPWPRLLLWRRLRGPALLPVGGDGHPLHAQGALHSREEYPDYATVEPRVFFVVDCESAIQALEHDSGFDLAIVLTEARVLRQQLRDRGVQVDFLWTPSHGKRPSWKPPAGQSALRLRALNTAADEAAGSCMERRRRSSRRQAWATAVKRASEWEAKALTATATIAKAYHDHFRMLGTRPREEAFTPSTLS